MSDTLISIIVPVYNVQEYIIECLDSIAAQTYTNGVECILVDDCGNDDSMKTVHDYLNRYKGEIDFRVVRHEHNRGLSAARNTGIMDAKGKYVLFVDSDDRILPDMFEKMINTLEKEDADVVCCGMRLLRDDGVVTPFKAWPEKEEIYIGSDCLQLLLDMKNGCGDFYMNKVYRRELFDGIRLPEGKVFEDIFSMHLVFERSKKTIFLPEGLYEYRLLSNSLSHSTTWKPSSLDFSASCKGQYIFIKEKYPKFTALATQKYVTAIIINATALALSDVPEQKEILSQFAKDLRALGDDLSLCSDDLKVKSRVLMNGARHWVKRCRAIKYYEDQHNHPKLQAILKPIIRPW